MENQEGGIVHNDVEVTQEQTASQPEVQKETVVEEKTKWSDLPPEVRKGRLERQLKAINKELGIEEEKPKAKPKAKSSDLTEDYGKLAYLKANGIEAEDEIELIENVMSETGKNLREVLNNKYFQAELKDMRAEKMAQEAIPTSSKRTGNSAKDSVDYWLTQPFEKVPPEMRIKVVNAKIEREKRESMFTDEPLKGSW